MSYVKAADIMPQELIEQIQQYINGGCIYIPRKEEEKKAWGSNTNIREELDTRNQAIWRAYRQGMSTTKLADYYCLSIKSVQRIIREEKRIRILL